MTPAPGTRRLTRLPISLSGGFVGQDDDMLSALVFAMGLVGPAAAFRASRPSGCEAFQEDNGFCSQLRNSCHNSRARMLCPITCDACNEDRPDHLDWATCTEDQRVALSSLTTGLGPFDCHGEP